MPRSSVRFRSGALWGQVDTVGSLTHSSGCFPAMFELWWQTFKHYPARRPVSPGCVNSLGGCSWYERGFWQMVCVDWHPHGCQESGFLSRILHCSEVVSGFKVVAKGGLLLISLLFTIVAGVYRCRLDVLGYLNININPMHFKRYCPKKILLYTADSFEYKPCLTCSRMSKSFYLSKLTSTHNPQRYLQCEGQRTRKPLREEHKTQRSHPQLCFKSGGNWFIDLSDLHSGQRLVLHPTTFHAIIKGNSV